MFRNALASFLTDFDAKETNLILWLNAKQGIVIVRKGPRLYTRTKPKDIGPLVFELRRG
jgi:hypothetical protein